MLKFLFGEKKYLYLMCGDGLMFKIGISNDPKRRVKEVAHNPRIVSTYKYYKVEKIEKFFHKFFKKKRRVRTGSGKTEWFKLGILEVIVVKFLMVTVKILQELGVLALFVTLVVGVLYLINHFIL